MNIWIYAGIKEAFKNCLNGQCQPHLRNVLFSASVCRSGFKRLRPQFQTFAAGIANVILNIVCFLGSVEKTWGSFLNEAYLRRTYLQGRMHVLARADARTCKDGCTYLRGRLQVLALRNAVHCKYGCSALQRRLQCTASEMDKTGTETFSPILDKRKGREEDSIGALHPPEYFC